MSTTTNSVSTRMPSRRVVSYALGDVANNVSFMMTSLFLMVYMTDIVGIPAAIAGTIYGVTKVWAGVTDLIAGNTVGRKETKWGRLRPWLVWVSPFLAISLVLLFSTPAGLSPAAAIAWVLIFDALFQLCYSFVNIPYGSLSAAMTQNAIDRSRLAGARSIAGAVTGVALAAVLSPQFEDTTADNIRLSFTIVTIVLAVIASILYFLCFRGTREVVPASPGKLKLSSTLKMVARNKPLIVLCIGAFFLLGSVFTMNAVMMYYARDVLGGASNFIWLQLAQTIGMVLLASMVPTITERLGKRIGYVALAVVVVIGFVIIGLAPVGSLPVALLGWFVLGAGYGGTNALMFSMQADTVDYGEWKTDVRAEGGSYSILSFIRKVGQGVGGFIGGAVIAAFGYSAGAPAQTPEAIQGIQVAAGWVPAGIGVIAALIIVFYPLKGEEHSAIVTELQDRNAKRAVGETTSEHDAVSVATDDGRLLTVRPIVTVNAQYGTGSQYVAEQVAQRLDVPYAGTAWTSEDLERAESELSAPLRSGAVSTFLHALSRHSQDADASLSVNAQSDTAYVRQNIAEVVDFVRGSGGVIVGRDATVVLAAMPRALHVRLEAPAQERIARVEARGISRDVAARRQRREDRVRTQMSRRLMNWEPAERRHYDLVIDTSEVSLDDAVDMIVDAARAKLGE